MRKFLTSCAAFLFFLPGIVWGQAPIERGAPPPSKTSNLTLEQEHVIKEIIIKDRKVEEAPAYVRVAVGDTVPQSIPLHQIPAEVGDKLAQIKTHLFFVQNAKVFIVDPKDNRVTDIID